MGIEGLKTIGYPAAYKTGAQKKSPASTDFEQQKSHTVNNPKKTYTMYLKTDDMLYAGGNGTGLSFYIKYAPDSTAEDPIVTAKGVDENGNAFERTIHINKINPKNATLVEMRALEAYLGVDKNGGLSSLPPDCGQMGLNDRANFMDMFRKQIRDMGILKERQLVSYYQYSMQMYQDFLDRNEKEFCYGSKPGRQYFYL